MKSKAQNIFVAWGRRINWKKRVKAVCKPCWEIKYCPYGPLVEQFPLGKDEDSRRCRIFGHICPVFMVAEPITETKELRRVTRDIPRPVQFRVMKRENQICSTCKKSVPDGDIHFDHIIPFSRGGSSDESNIRLLCDSCNTKRSNLYETEFLVSGFTEHTQEHLSISFLDILIGAFDFAHRHREKTGAYPDAKALSEEYTGVEAGIFEELVSSTFTEFREVLVSSRPLEMTRNQSKALLLRWGYINGNIHPLAEVAERYGEDVETLVIFERALISRSGFHLKEDKYSRQKWIKK